MKKQILTAALLIPISVFPQTLDSVANQELIMAGEEIGARVITTYIPGLPNDLVVSILSLIVAGISALIHRKITIKKWKKAGKIVNPDLKDK